jgi:hypothetical protein
MNSQGDFQPADQSLPVWEVVQKPGLFSLGKPVLRKGSTVLAIEGDGYRTAKCESTNWCAEIETSKSHHSLLTRFQIRNRSAQFYLLLGYDGTVRVSHPELAVVNRTIGGVSIELMGVGAAQRRESWKDKDTSRNVVAFVEILNTVDEDSEQLLAWLCLAIGIMAYVPSSDG